MSGGHGHGHSVGQTQWLVAPESAFTANMADLTQGQLEACRDNSTEGPQKSPAEESATAFFTQALV